MSQVRETTVEAKSTDVFGRVQCTARNHHFIIDGPVQNGCPGEALTPPEVFLAGVAACGVELLHVISRELGLPLTWAHVRIDGTVDRGNPVREDLTLFNRVRLQFELRGVSESQGADLVERFKRR
jgi:uncharacterized OsmC-like protein